MALPDFTGTAVTYNLFVRLASSDDPTNPYRFVAGPESVAVHSSSTLDATWYGNVISFCQLQHDAGDGPFPTLIIPKFSFTVARSDQSADTVDEFVGWLADQATANATLGVTVYMSAGAVIDSATDLIFAGRASEGGIYISGDTVEVTAKGTIDTYNREVPSQSIEELYAGGLIIMADLEQDRLGDSTCILYGDWSDTASRYATAFPVIRQPDGDSNGHRVHVTADNGHGFQSVSSSTRLYQQKDGTHDFAFYSTSASDTYFDVTSDKSIEYDPTLETIYIAPMEIKGLVDSSLNLITSPASIIYDLLVNFGGVIASTIDDASFTAVRANQTYRFRSYIENDLPVLDHIADICRDAGLILVERGGTIYLYQHQIYFWETNQDSDYIITPGRAGWSQKITHRPTGWNYGTVRLKYRYSPRLEKYLKTYTMGTGGKTLTIESKWVHVAQDARDIVSSIYSAIVDVTPRRLEMDLPFGIDASQNDIIEWTGDGINGQQFIITGVTASLDTGASRLSAMAMSRDWYYGGWTYDTDPDFDSATLAEKIRDGYWCGTAPADDIEDYTRWQQ